MSECEYVLILQLFFAGTLLCQILNWDTFMTLGVGNDSCQENFVKKDHRRNDLDPDRIRKMRKM